LENQGDVDTQALAGAIATGTHGTGPRFGNLSSRVTALCLVTALFPDDFFIIDDCSLQPVLVPGVAYLSAENDVVHAND
jgi:FAD/FMN-containing dehydrogenase